MWALLTVLYLAGLMVGTVDSGYDATARTSDGPIYIPICQCETGSQAPECGSGVQRGSAHGRIGKNRRAGAGDILCQCDGVVARSLPRPDSATFGAASPREVNA